MDDLTAVFSIFSLLSAAMLVLCVKDHMESP